MQTGCRIRGRLTAVAAAALVLLPAGAQADDASLYRGPEPRPGPDILYEPPAEAPQLGNAGIWNAPPILISGASAYRGGEFLYQDFLYDDHGARAGERDPSDPRSGGDSFSQPNGTYTYPTDSRYAGNAADLVELRVKKVPGETVFRITLNTLIDPELVGGTIAIGDSATPQVVPHGANATVPAELFLTWHGSSAEIVEAGTGTPKADPSTSVDMERRQVEIRVPAAAWNPTGVVKLAAGLGLWDTANNRYLLPQREASESRPGGAGDLANPTAFFNVAFRYDEPFPNVSSPDTLTNPTFWRDRQQGNSLRSGDLSPFRADVDFGKLASGADDESRVPRTGPMNRILASHFETKQGTDYSEDCDASNCEGPLRGRLQPYSIYIPEKQPPNGRYGLTLLLHSLAANYNQFSNSRNQSQLGERGTGSIVITPAGRGPDGWYFDHAGADTFEVWADVAARFPLDPDYVAISGYSMGGYGTYKLATQFPDLFGAANPVVGPPGHGVWSGPPMEPSGGAHSNTYHQLESVRHIPFMIWVGSTDQLVPISGTTAQAQRFDALGYRYVFDVFEPADHFTLAINDQYQPAADFLGEKKVVRDPARVSYVVNPRMDFGDVRTVADHAYWLSALRLRSASGSAPRGRIDVRSEGFGQGDPPEGATRTSAGVLTGGIIPALAFERREKDWGEAPAAPARNRLVILARNVGSVLIHPERAKVDCRAELAVDSDGPITIGLAGCVEPARTIRCLPRRARLRRKGLGQNLRLRHTRKRTRALAGRPAARTRSTYRYCVNGGGKAAVVWGKGRRKNSLIATTARRHRARGGLHPRQRMKRPPRGSRRLAKGLYRRKNVIFRIRRKRVKFVAVADRRTLRRPARVRRLVRRSGL